jgi:hypothetical protein
MHLEIIKKGWWPHSKNWDNLELLLSSICEHHLLTFLPVLFWEGLNSQMQIFQLRVSLYSSSCTKAATMSVSLPAMGSAWGWAADGIWCLFPGDPGRPSREQTGLLQPKEFLRRDCCGGQWVTSEPSSGLSSVLALEPWDIAPWVWTPELWRLSWLPGTPFLKWCHELWAWAKVILNCEPEGTVGEGVRKMIFSIKVLPS